METMANDNTENAEKQMNGATKRCFNCHDEHNSGAKKCRTCLVQRKTDKIDIDDERIRNMKTPNASKQFDKLKYRAKVLNFHCGWDIVVMASHRHSRGTSFVRFGTSGLGEEFIGANEHQSSSPTGKAVFNVFSSYIRENKKSDPKRPTLGKEEPPSQSPAVSILSPVTPIPFATSIFPVTSISSSMATSGPSSLSSSINSGPLSLSSSVTSQPSSLSSSVTSRPSSLSSSVTSRPSSLSSSVTSRPSSLSSSITSRPSSLSSSVTSQPSSLSSSSRPSSFSHPPFTDPPLSTSLSSSPTTGPTTTDSASLNTTIKLPSDALVVVDNGKCVAVGKSVPLTSVHGQIVPDTHKCILLTWAQDNYLAPFPCGNRDLKENLYFSKDSFYAVPRTMLRQLIRKNNQYSLSPIS